MDTLPPKIRVLIIEDHSVVRKGLRRLLEDQPDIQVIEDTEFGEEGVRIVQEQAPDVVLLDLLLETSQINGIEALKQIVKLSPSTQVVILTFLSDEATVLPALRSGAIGYVLKNSLPTEMVEAIRDAAMRRYHIDPVILKKIVENGATTHTSTGQPKISDELTDREKEIVLLIQREMSNQEIAERLVISRATVKTHVSNILHKLGVSKRSEIPIKLALEGEAYTSSSERRNK